MVELKQHTHYLLIQSINNMSNTMAFHAQRTTLFFTMLQQTIEVDQMKK